MAVQLSTSNAKHVHLETTVPLALVIQAIPSKESAKTVHFSTVTVNTVNLKINVWDAVTNTLLPKTDYVLYVVAN